MTMFPSEVASATSIPEVTPPPGAGSLDARAFRKSLNFCSPTFTSVFPHQEMNKVLRLLLKRGGQLLHALVSDLRRGNEVEV